MAGRAGGNDDHDNDDYGYDGDDDYDDNDDNDDKDHDDDGDDDEGDHVDKLGNNLECSLWLAVLSTGKRSCLETRATFAFSVTLKSPNDVRGRGDPKDNSSTRFYATVQDTAKYKRNNCAFKLTGSAKSHDSEQRGQHVIVFQGCPHWVRIFRERDVVEIWRERCRKKQEDT